MPRASLITVCRRRFVAETEMIDHSKPVDTNGHCFVESSHHRHCNDACVQPAKHLLSFLGIVYNMLQSVPFDTAQLNPFHKTADCTREPLMSACLQVWADTVDKDFKNVD